MLFRFNLNGSVPRALTSSLRCLKGEYEIEVKKVTKKRTNRQNRAMHLYFTLLAQALDDAGYDIRSVLRKDFKLPWTAYAVKEYIWRKVQNAVLNKKSTTKLTREEVGRVYDFINREIGTLTGVYVPFPNEDELFNNYQKENVKKNAKRNG